MEKNFHSTKWYIGRVAAKCQKWIGLGVETFGYSLDQLLPTALNSVSSGRRPYFFTL